jgi:hypothetical protein
MATVSESGVAGSATGSTLTIASATVGDIYIVNYSVADNGSGITQAPTASSLTGCSALFIVDQGGTFGIDAFQHFVNACGFWFVTATATTIQFGLSNVTGLVSGNADVYVFQVPSTLT